MNISILIASLIVISQAAQLILWIILRRRLDRLEINNSHLEESRRRAEVGEVSPSIVPVRHRVPLSISTSYDGQSDQNRGERGGAKCM
jgi:hypothetical protein